MNARADAGIEPVTGSRAQPWDGMVTQRLVAALQGAIVGVDTTEPIVALTFDDGPHPEYTPELLSLLDRHDARATFFLVGEAAARSPTLVREIATRGHVVGNHSWSHPSFTMISSPERRRELQRCETVLAPHAAPLFRPPYGDHSRATRRDAHWCGHVVVGWSLDVHDWCEGDRDTLVNALENGIRPGGIVLLHDAIHDLGAPTVGPVVTRPAIMDRRIMLNALDAVLGRLSARFRFVTLPELLRAGSVITQT